MAKDEFLWDAVIAGVFGIGVGTLIGRASAPVGVKPAGQAQLSDYAAIIQQVVYAINADCLRAVVRTASVPRVTPAIRSVGIHPSGQAATIPPGTYASWLTHNGWSCSFWTNLSRQQQIQFIFGWFIGNDRSATAKGNDSYNQNFTKAVFLAFPALSQVPTLTDAEVLLLRQRLGLGGSIPTPP